MTPKKNSHLRFSSARWRRIALTLMACLGTAGAALAAPTKRAPAPADWFHVFPIDERTYAISEPKYWQKNVSYLLLGTRQALLFDTGPGVYGIRSVVRS